MQDSISRGDALQLVMYDMMDVYDDTIIVCFFGRVREENGCSMSTQLSKIIQQLDVNQVQSISSQCND